jgi:hypothetical protein
MMSSIEAMFERCCVGDGGGVGADVGVGKDEKWSICGVLISIV